MQVCKAHVTLGDRGPYFNLIESLRALCSACSDRVPSRKRKSVRKLRHVMKRVYDRLREYVRRGMTGIADILYTEMAGLGGLSLFRRLDTAFVDFQKTELRAVPERFDRREYRNGHGEYQNDRRFYSAPRGGRGGRAGRGGGRVRDLSDMTCYNCYQTGHVRKNCPSAGSKAPPSKA